MSGQGGFWPAAFSSETDEWATPGNFFRQLDHEFGFTLDPCSTHENAKCAKHFTREEDGLSRSWGGEMVFMNPPYGDVIGDWMRKAWQEAQGGATVVCLVPARTDTAWWHDYATKGQVRFIRGRLKFGAAEQRTLSERSRGVPAARDANHPEHRPAVHHANERGRELQLRLSPGALKGERVTLECSEGQSVGKGLR